GEGGGFSQGLRVPGHGVLSPWRRDPVERAAVGAAVGREEAKADRGGRLGQARDVEGNVAPVSLSWAQPDLEGGVGSEVLARLRLLDARVCADRNVGELGGWRRCAVC